jgi:hypothetical protein
VRCMQIFCPMQSTVKVCVVIKLTKANKEEEYFVDIAPGWG